ncbi:hypothetical protein A2867_04835 [Candidatus Daviesbacteria bacterium RIFCSPHIGHO2_01_FULL_40_11]|uniref:Uncharacterized protein n=1 Tax=Candidatus Daviesbacteria bacterium RIFCSPHIGHO2_01_FULL_40_11 TaxID=1797762 RepID=A0A1F5JI29_9BACT|nr:MAG: hypothetical protein A2867_04835 [Candidatus Daviesbacteria bacterium RIFCSPHIGHO2_01_FULL_40_11]OGE62939.1 MAG: hypothetical protein A2964_00330 [Candidatus Daviesbacteria bacterium RIFCSPLOWO2_01_FULL_40_27]
MLCEAKVPPRAQVMKKLETIEFTYYTGNCNVTSFEGDPDAEETFYVYKATRYPDGSAVTRRIGLLDCTEQQIKRWLELRERIEKDIRHQSGLRGIFNRFGRLFRAN